MNFFIYDAIIVSSSSCTVAAETHAMVLLLPCFLFFMMLFWCRHPHALLHWKLTLLLCCCSASWCFWCCFCVIIRMHCCNGISRSGSVVAVHLCVSGAVLLSSSVYDVVFVTHALVRLLWYILVFMMLFWCIHPQALLQRKHTLLFSCWSTSWCFWWCFGVVIRMNFGSGHSRSGSVVVVHLSVYDDVLVSSSAFTVVAETQALVLLLPWIFLLRCCFFNWRHPHALLQRKFTLLFGCCRASWCLWCCFGAVIRMHCCSGTSRSS